MKIFTNLDDWRGFRRSLDPTLSIGLVPTMGNLHAGHATLFARSKAENDCSVATVFVNPTQFNQAQDFTTYPRTVADDCELLRAQGVDYCLIPSEEDIYRDNYQYQVTELTLCQLMEGKHRPGHFNGVLTVVLKLLNLIRPTRAYFGEKDYQQFLLIKGMASAFFLETEIIPCATIRETSALAYSSRNSRLNLEERVLAEQFARIFHQDKPCDTVIAELEALGLEVDYVLDYEGRRFAAVYVGEVRLIDNYELPESEPRP